jgi:hypothetical protein
MFTQKADIDALRSCLEPKGVREAALARAWEFYSDALGGTGVLRDNGDAEMAAPEPEPIALPPSSDTWEAAVTEALRNAQFERFLKVCILLKSSIRTVRAIGMIHNMHAPLHCLEAAPASPGKGMYIRKHVCRVLLQSLLWFYRGEDDA